MIRYLNVSFTGLLFFMSVVTMISCKKDFDNPPGFQEPDITANTSIKALKALHTAGKFEQITDDKIIEGIVIADDKSGNFFLNIVMQDSTGGITIRLDGNGLYTSYPVGRKVFIKCKGLYLNDYNGLIQLGGGIDNSDPSRPSLTTIASALIDSFLVKGSVGNVITPKVVTLDQLTTSLQDPYQSTLIQLDNFEFTSSDLDSTYADPENKASVSAVNRTIKNCSGKSVILRNSSYANFAGLNVPQGNGSIVAVYSVFRTDKQLFIRDTADLKFTGERCTGGGGGGGTGALISIAALRALYTGSDIDLGSYKVGGVVISDASNKNISNGSVVIQNGNSGISVFMGGTLTYKTGDSIVLDLASGDSLINYRGSLEIKTHFGFTKPAAVATGKVITPQVKTISDLTSALSLPLGDPGNFEFTLVKIVGATAPTGTYSGNKTLTDASGTITLYTAGAATFSGSTIPTGSIDLVGYVSTFSSTKQFQIRNTNDVSGGTVTPPTGTVLLDENFESTTPKTTLALPGWNNTGDTTFQAQSFSNNKYAQITAFKTALVTVKSWLITPGLNLDATTGELLTFKTKDGFNNGATLKVQYSTNYDGTSAPSTATWTDLPATIASGTASGYATNFTNSGDVSLNTITGAKVYIAFVYEGGDPGKTTTYQVDDVKVVAD